MKIKNILQESTLSPESIESIGVRWPEILENKAKYLKTKVSDLNTKQMKDVILVLERYVQAIKHEIELNK